MKELQIFVKSFLRPNIAVSGLQTLSFAFKAFSKKKRERERKVRLTSNSMIESLAQCQQRQDMKLIQCL